MNRAGECWRARNATPMHRDATLGIPVLLAFSANASAVDIYLMAILRCTISIRKQNVLGQVVAYEAY